MRADELMSRAAALGLNIERATEPKGTAIPEWTAEDAAHACGGLPERYYCAFAYRYAGDDTVRSRLWGALMGQMSLLAVEERWTQAQLECDGFAWQTLSSIESEPTGIARGIRRAAGPAKSWKPLEEDFVPWDWMVYAPATIRVLPALVELVLIEEFLATRYPKGLAQVRLVDAWPDLVGMGRQHWARYGEKQYQAARAIFEEWCGTAYSHVARRIRDEWECDAA